MIQWGLRGEVLKSLSSTIDFLKVRAHQVFRLNAVLYVPLNRGKVVCVPRSSRFALSVAAGQANRSNLLDLSLFRYLILADRSRA